MSVSSEQPDEHQLQHLLDAIEGAESVLTFAEPPNLRALHAGRETLRARVDGHAFKWFDQETEGLALGGAGLSGATFSHAVLDGANLRGAILSKAVGQGVDLSHSVIEESKFDNADLSGACFNAVKGGEADFSGAMLEDARFEHASLRYANLRNTLLDASVFTAADLWGACLRGTDADEASFRDARLDEADLSHANFAGADFSGASLKKANLEHSNLSAVDFSGAHLEGAKLNSADLSRASLPRLNLLSCDLTHVRLADTWLELTRLRARQLGGAIGEELAGEFDLARQAYIGLEQNFRTLGNSDDESWAFRKRRVMGKRHEGSEARQAIKQGHYRKAVGHGVHWLSNVFIEWLCDYGESLWRVARAFLMTIAMFALAYDATGALTRLGSDGKRVPTHDVLDVLAYSFLEMLSTSVPDIGLKPLNEAVVIVSSVQGALGIVLIGLFGYVLGNRMHR